MGLKKYVTSRILQLLFTYWAFLTILFGVFRLAPGDPTSMYLAQEMGPEERQRILEQYGLNEPMHIQYFDFIAQFLTGDFGQSFRFGEPVWDVMVVKFWNTILLMGVAFLLAYTIGVLLGAFLGWVRQTRTEKAGIIVTLLARSSPEFWIGIVVLMIFPFGLGWFPAGGMRSPGAEWSWFWGRYLSWDFVEHMVLPVLTGVIYYMATPTLLMRSSMINVLDADFIDIKKAEGIPEHIILYKHAARNSILPMVTVVALVVGLSIGGSLVIETVFNWPGMGRAMINAVTYNDYPLAQALFFLMGSIVIFMNFVADIAYVYLDPRVRYD